LTLIGLFFVSRFIWQKTMRLAWGALFFYVLHTLFNYILSLRLLW
jgi:hypothetical protein